VRCACFANAPRLVPRCRAAGENLADRRAARRLHAGLDAAPRESIGADSRVLRLDAVVDGLAEGLRRKIFFAW
jgi:hypothetical protein